MSSYQEILNNFYVRIKQSHANLPLRFIPRSSLIRYYPITVSPIAATGLGPLLLLSPTGGSFRSAAA
jgi:hypothetical protein